MDRTCPVISWPLTRFLDQVTCDDQTVVVLVMRPNDSSVAVGCSQLFVGGGLDLQESPLDIEGIPFRNTFRLRRTSCSCEPRDLIWCPNERSFQLHRLTPGSRIWVYLQSVASLSLQVCHWPCRRTEVSPAVTASVGGGLPSCFLLWVGCGRLLKGMAESSS